MEKFKRIHDVIKSALILACYRALDKHIGTIYDFEKAGVLIGEELSECISDAVSIACECYPEEFRERLERSIRKGVGF